MAGKVHKTLRLESSLDDAVRGLKREGESDNAAYARVLQAGVAALLADVSASTDVSTHEHKSEHTDEHTQKALVAALQAHIGALESESADLRSRLDLAQEHEREMADALAQQAATASRLAEQAQMLQAAQMKTAHPWRARLAGLVHGKRKDGEK